MLLDALFAQASSFGGTLTSFKLRVAFANDIERALALHDLAVFVTAFHGHE